MLTEESEDVVLPLIKCRVDKVVPIPRCFTDWWIDLQKMRLGKACKLVSHGVARHHRVVVRGVKEHERNGCLAYRTQHALAYFG